MVDLSFSQHKQNLQTINYHSVLGINTNRYQRQSNIRYGSTSLRKQSILASVGQFRGTGGSDGNSGGGILSSAGGFRGDGGSLQFASSSALDTGVASVGAISAGIVGGTISAVSGGSSSGSFGGGTSFSPSTFSSPSSGNPSGSLRLNFDQIDIPEVPLYGVIAAGLVVFTVYTLQVR